MNIIIQSLGFNAGQSLETFIREKINAVKDDKIVRANVVLYKGPALDTENDYCEIRLEVPGNDHFVKKHSRYFETAVSECVDILSQMIKKSKEKSGDKRSYKGSVILDDNSQGVNDDFELDDLDRK